MGRKKPRVAADADSSEQGLTEPNTMTTTVSAAPPPSFLLPPPPIPTINNNINNIPRIAPNDPRRNLVTNTSATTSVISPNPIPNGVNNAYCQPVNPTSSSGLLIVNETSPAVRSTITSYDTSTGLHHLTNPPTYLTPKPVGNTGELIEEDIYVSDGSDWEKEEEEEHTDTEFFSCDDMDQSDDEEEPKDVSHAPSRKKKNDTLEIILTTSKMGLIRKGSVHQQLLLQAQHHNLQSKQWVRGKNPDPVAVTEGEEEDTTDVASQENKDMTETEEDQEKKLANLDPATRAAYLLAEKQRKLYEAKIAARILESSENAGRDPCLFSKRTAFDIRMDQIEEKPWMRIGGDITDYFNYGLTEEDWMEYAQQQLDVRQELTDASRQKRLPDPTIIPVLPRAPRKQQPRVAVAFKKDSKNDEEDESMIETPAVLGPTLPNKVEGDSGNTTDRAADSNTPRDPSSSKANAAFVDIGGGAWGAGAVPGSILAKLIEDQMNVSSGKPPPSIQFPPPPLPLPNQKFGGHPTDPRRSSHPDSINSHGDSFIYGAQEEKFTQYQPSNRRPGPGRWGETNDIPGPMYDDFGRARNSDWRDERNFNPYGPPNPRYPPGPFRPGHPQYPPQSAVGNGNNMPPPFYDAPFMQGPGMNYPPPPSEFHGDRGPPRRMGPGVPDRGPPGPPPPHPDAFEYEGNWRRPRDDFNPMNNDGVPFHSGGRFPPQGYPGNKFRR